MKKKQFYALFLCFSMFFMASCNKSSNSRTPLCHVVTQVEIQGREKDVHFSRRYTDNEKMQKVLIYLRTLDPDSRPIKAPKSRPLSTVEITLKFSDGKEKFYYQTNHKFISDNYQFCYSFDSAKAAGLYRLVSALPSDKGSQQQFKTSFFLTLSNNMTKSSPKETRK